MKNFPPSFQTTNHALKSIIDFLPRDDKKGLIQLNSEFREAAISSLIYQSELKLNSEPFKINNPKTYSFNSNKFEADLNLFKYANPNGYGNKIATIEISPSILQTETNNRLIKITNAINSSKVIIDLKIPKWIPEFSNLLALLNPNKIESLSITSHDLKDEILQALVTSNLLSNVTSLSLHANLDNEQLEKIPEYDLSKLRSLDLNGNNIGNDNLEILTKFNLPNLTSLNLGCNKINDAGIQHIIDSNLSNLISLDLGYNQIGDEGLKTIITNYKNLSKLSSINLSDNYISDKSMQYLSESKFISQLDYLDLANNNIGDNGVKYFFESKFQINIININLAHNNINSDGVKIIANSKYSSKITGLNIEGNDIQNQGLKNLIDSPFLSQLTSINLSGCNINDNGFAHLYSPKALPNLASITLDPPGIYGLIKSPKSVNTINTKRPNQKINIQYNAGLNPGLVRNLKALNNYTPTIEDSSNDDFYNF
jgi:hypothetical protein